MSKWDLIWPQLEPVSEALLRQLREAELTEIDKSTWQADPNGALREARALADREDERRQATDAKASNYLLAIVALMPLLTYLESTVWEHKFGTAPKWLSLPLLAVSVLFVLGAGWWAFKTLNVGVFHTMNAAELQDVWQDKNRDDRLINELFKNTRRNADAINAKVSCIKMAHIFLKRGILYFGLLVLSQVGWSAYEDGLPTARTWIASFAEARPEPLPAELASMVHVAKPERNTKSCNAAELAMQRATSEMNDLPSGRRFRGPVAYWVRLGASSRAEERTMGRAWDSLRQLYAGSYAIDCEAAGKGPPATQSAGDRTALSGPDTKGVDKH